MSTAILASGGMDSFLLWRLFAEEAINIFVDIDHPYAEKERGALRRLTQAVPTFDVLDVKGAPIGKLAVGATGIIPLRNAHMLLSAAQYADNLLMGVLEDEINSDKSPEFLLHMEQVLNISWRAQYWTSGRRFTLKTPLATGSKAHWVDEYLTRGYKIEPLLMTVSCYSDQVGHCGACPSCFKRWVALKLNGIDQYWHADPYLYGLQTDVVTKARDGTYGAVRAAETLKAMGCT